MTIIVQDQSTCSGIGSNMPMMGARAPRQFCYSPWKYMEIEHVQPKDLLVMVEFRSLPQISGITRAL